ncbi:hypothetical protein Tco_0386647, partial [Tanacetum coccineum]
KLDEKVEAEVDDAKEAEELKKCLEIVPDDGDDVTIDATPLSVKIPIVDYKIYQEGKKSFFKIIRADGKTHIFKKTKPVNYMDTFLHLNLKTLFEHHVEDSIWKNQQGLVKVLNWKLFNSYEVHCVTVQTIPYYLLVEKMYPLTKHTLHQMFNNVKLQVDYECEMAYKLLRLVKKQLKEGYKLDDFEDKYQVYGRIVGIKSLLEITVVKLVLLVQKLLRLVLKVNAAALYKLSKIYSIGINTTPHVRDPRDVEMIERLQQWIKNLSSSSYSRTCWQKRRKLSPTFRKMGQRTSILLAEETLDRDDRYRDDPIRSMGLKIEIPEFTGKVHPDAFIDWLSTVERVFDVRDIPDKLKVKLVAIKLR